MKRSTSFGTVIVSVAAAAILLKRALVTPRSFRSQVVILTGGSSGLGLAMAHRFGREGAKLVLAARDGDQLERARLDLLAGSVADEDDILLVSCDVSDKQQAAGLIESAHRAFGSIDLLINNAGIIEVGPAENQTVEVFERAMAIDFFGAVYTTYALLPYFLKRRAGAIVNISSIGGKVAVPHLLPYVAAKFALTGFSEGLHAELRHKGIRVTTVCPGLMRTGGESHAHFSGQVEKEKQWFQTAARTPVLAASVEYAADKIFRSVRAGCAEVTITPQAWLAARFAGVAPATTQVVSALVNRYLLPEAASQP